MRSPASLFTQHREHDWESGPVLGRYELLMRIASGGMATVWAARLRGSRGFQKIVALKTILPRFSDDAKYESMFLDEATLAGQIRHPNVAQILDLGEDNGVLFLAMEWIDGISLDELLRKAHAGGVEIPLSVAIRIAIQAASGLHAAHELRDGDDELVGLVHGDVSPQNIVVSFDGVTKVVDFGLAKLTAADLQDGTRSEKLRGKLAYLAPEQIRGEPTDRRADLFSLGILLYMLTTGVHPFQGRTASATLYNISGAHRVRPPSELVPDYPSELEAAVLRCLEKDPARRFPTGDELVWALESSIPADLRATDQDVAVLMRLMASDMGARRGRAMLGGLVPSRRPSPRPHRPHLLTIHEAHANGPRARTSVITTSRDRRSKHRLRGALVLCASLIGTAGALTVGSALLPTATESSQVALPAAATAPTSGMDIESAPAMQDDFESEPHAGGRTVAERSIERRGRGAAGKRR